MSVSSIAVSAAISMVSVLMIKRVGQNHWICWSVGASRIIR